MNISEQLWGVNENRGSADGPCRLPSGRVPSPIIVVVMSALYLVATPIGNLEDITLRALRVLRDVTLVASEDTRATRKLMTHHGISSKLISYHQHSRRTRKRELLDELREGNDVALVSEAGTPTISDPGSDLVSAAIDAGFEVVPVPGPSALTAALSVSGLAVGQFIYLGFLPRRHGPRCRLLTGLVRESRKLVAFEAPHRLRDSLADILTVLGDRPITVCREMTKRYEELYRGSVGRALEHFGEPRGEFTLVVEGAIDQDEDGTVAGLALADLRQLRARGEGTRDAVATIQKRYGLPKRQVYELWLGLKGS